MMRVGFYKDELIEYEGFYDKDSVDAIEDVAIAFADDNHEIHEDSDCNFSVYVQDDSGVTHEVEFITEFTPSFVVDSVSSI